MDERPACFRQRGRGCAAEGCDGTQTAYGEKGAAIACCSWSRKKAGNLNFTPM